MVCCIDHKIHPDRVRSQCRERGSEEVDDSKGQQKFFFEKLWVEIRSIVVAHIRCEIKGSLLCFSKSEPLEYDRILVVFSSVECVLDRVWVSILRFKQEGSWFLPHVTVQSRAVLTEVIQGPRLKTAALASSWNRGLHPWVYGTSQWEREI